MQHGLTNTTKPARKFKHLTFEQRHQLQGMLKTRRCSVKEIAAHLGVHVSTVYRERKRGCVTNLGRDLAQRKVYSADYADDRRRESLETCGPGLKIASNHALCERLSFLIREKRYSPYAALTTCQQDANLTCDISLKTLYNYINNYGFPVTANLLRNSIQRRKQRKAKQYPKRQAFRNKKGRLITLRPQAANDRSEMGHHEMDLVVGKQGTPGCLLVLTERKSRFEHIIKLPDKTQESVHYALDRLEAHYGTKRFKKLFKSITCDNGPEFLNSDVITRSIRGKTPRTELFYAHPFSSSERGSNENANRLIRRFIPKSVSMESITDEQVNRLAIWMNTYPRKLLNGRSSAALAREFTFHSTAI